MKRLWVQLSIAFGVLVLFSLVVIVGTTRLLIAVGSQPFLVDVAQVPGGPISELQTYYDTHHNWDGIEPFLAGVESTLSLATIRQLRLVITSADGQAVYYATTQDGHQTPDWISSKGRLLSTLPIVTGNAVRGYLSVIETESALPDRQQWFQDLFQAFVPVLVAIVGVLGTGFGIFISRRLTAPLNQLAEAAQAIGARDLSRRVAVRGSQEFVAVAQAFNNMADALERAERLRRNLVADVAHELRTPLSVLRGSLRAILDNVYSLDKAEVARLYDQTRVLSRLVDDLQELTLAEAHQLRMNLQPVDLVSLVRDMTQTFGPIAESEGITFEVKTPEQMPLINADAVRLTQVLHNLLMNALRHMPTGGTVYLSAEAENGAAQLVVRDTGDGIPPEHLPHVFDRFYSADHTRNRRVSGGAGLGLTIARAIVEAHKGQIAVTSDGIVGHGTTFTIRLPVA
jgi:two-component system OmpR family sensor kinase